MDTCGETVYGDTDNQKTEQGTSLVKMATALIQATPRYCAHLHSRKCLSRMDCYLYVLSLLY